MSLSSASRARSDAGGGMRASAAGSHKAGAASPCVPMCVQKTSVGQRQRLVTRVASPERETLIGSARSSRRGNSGVFLQRIDGGLLLDNMMVRGEETPSSMGHAAALLAEAAGDEHLAAQRSSGDASSSLHTTGTLISRPHGRGKQLSAQGGAYMAQVRMLEAIFSRARRDAAASGSAGQRTQPPPHGHVSNAPAQPPPRQFWRTAGGSAQAQQQRRTQQPGSTASRAVAATASPATAAGVAVHAVAGELRPSAMQGTHGVNGGAAAPGVRSVLLALSGQSGQPLQDAIKEVSTIALNHALIVLGSERRHSDVLLLLRAVVDARADNEHTHAAAISALDASGRFDMALAHFEGLMRRGTDVGPVCASVLIKLCAQRRDLPLALDVFHRLAGHSTLNRFTYNCLVHLCSVLGRMDDALMVLGMMHDDGSPDCRPDGYTYAALLKCIDKSKRWALLPRVARDVCRTRGAIDSEVWCLLITLAGRARRPDLAQHYWEVAVSRLGGASAGRGPGRVHVDNALLGARARFVPPDEMRAMYRAMLCGGLVPDEYSFNAMLTNAVVCGVSLHDVDDLVGEMAKWRVRINLHLGTTLVNAYRRCPEVSDAAGSGGAHGPGGALLLEKAHDVLSALAAARQANAHTYGTVACIHAALGDGPGVARVLSRMEATGVPADVVTLSTVGKACDDAGLAWLAAEMDDRTREMEMEPSALAGDWPNEAASGRGGEGRGEGGAVAPSRRASGSSNAARKKSEVIQQRKADRRALAVLPP
ncbi:hypothetical protein FOA52_006683 [Chlamydomonas sp. UWO 241]|nr:hypothetical protein FOA52_006683 [Chlamydomonas sp. UWO 241]